MQDKWYAQAQDYWNKIPPTIDGVLGGFGSISDIDSMGSLEFLKSYMQTQTIQRKRACDCGAGIGRVSKGFLLKCFQSVDIVEQNPAFVDESRHYLNGESVDKFITMGLQDFNPESNRYDLIWCQWVLGHLKDEDFIEFFKRCKVAISENNGLLGVKENITKEGIDIDDVDSSMTRSDVILKDLFKRAGLTIVKEAKQTGFPSSLYSVKMYLLK